jgi:ribosome assembly protein 4
VRPITRISSSLEGHTEAILQTKFNFDSTQIISASGDKTIRVWDTLTECPRKTMMGHKSWVLCAEWSPLGSFLASGGMDN